MADRKLQWHPAFQAALQIELEDDREFLQFHEEYNLNKKPLQVDTLIINMKSGYRTKKSIGWIFRKYNIIEYKNPWDYISVNDFYKVMSYACSYQSNTAMILERPPEEITVTLIGNRYPRKLIRHLRESHHVMVESVYPGIYYIKGLMFPLQIIVSRKLPSKEYIWLSRLRDDLVVEGDVDVLSDAYRGRDQDPLYSAAMEFIVRANKKEYEEGIDMCQALEELFEEKLKKKAEEIEAQAEIRAEARVAAKAEARVVIAQIRKKFQKHNTPSEAAEALELEEDYVKRVMELIQEQPDYDNAAIASYLIKQQEHVSGS